MVPDDVKPYLDYLDKEMTIMGILSAFCVGAAALVAREVLKISGTGELFAARQADFYYIVTGSGLMLVAAAAFYWQRAQLAWHYGQVSLWATDVSVSGRDLPDILYEVSHVVVLTIMATLVVGVVAIRRLSRDRHTPEINHSRAPRRLGKGKKKFTATRSSSTTR